jgi:hypothetical protein
MRRVAMNFDRHDLVGPGRGLLVHEVVVGVDADTPDFLELMLCVAFLQHDFESLFKDRKTQ